jgi:hypothetical protein
MRALTIRSLAPSRRPERVLGFADVGEGQVVSAEIEPEVVDRPFTGTDLADVLAALEGPAMACRQLQALLGFADVNQADPVRLQVVQEISEDPIAEPELLELLLGTACFGIDERRQDIRRIVDLDDAPVAVTLRIAADPARLALLLKLTQLGPVLDASASAATERADRLAVRKQSSG